MGARLDCGMVGGGAPVMTPEKIKVGVRLYAARELTVEEIAKTIRGEQKDGLPSSTQIHD
jgi:hypothetical protein